MSGLFADVDTASLLGEHVLMEGREWTCGADDCDWSLPFTRRDEQPNDAHRAHQAAILDAHYADRVRAAQEKAVSQALAPFRLLIQDWKRANKNGPVWALVLRELVVADRAAELRSLPSHADKETTACPTT